MKTTYRVEHRWPKHAPRWRSIPADDNIPTLARARDIRDAYRTIKTCRARIVKTTSAVVA